MKIVVKIISHSFLLFFFYSCKKTDLEQDKNLYYNIWVYYSADSLTKEKLVLFKGDSASYVVFNRMSNEFPICGASYYYMPDTVIKGELIIDNEKLIIGKKTILKMNETIISRKEGYSFIETKDGKRFKSYYPGIYQNVLLENKLTSNEKNEPCQYYYDKWFEPFSFEIYSDSEYSNLYSKGVIIKSEYNNGNLILHTNNKEYFSFTLNSNNFYSSLININNAFYSVNKSFASPTPTYSKTGTGHLNVRDYNTKLKYISGDFMFSINSFTPTIEPYSIDQLGNLLYRANFDKPVYLTQYVRCINFPKIFIHE